MKTRDSIIINRKLSQVFEIARDMEHQHEYIPGYEPAKIIERTDRNHLIVERTAKQKNGIMRWRSRAEIIEGKAIKFEQIEGRLKGMKIEWLFEPKDEATIVTITHNLRMPPPVIGWLMAELIAKPVVEKLTAGTLKGLKQRCESGPS